MRSRCATRRRGHTSANGLTPPRASLAIRSSPAPTTSRAMRTPSTMRGSRRCDVICARRKRLSHATMRSPDTCAWCTPRSIGRASNGARAGTEWTTGKATRASADRSGERGIEAMTTLNGFRPMMTLLLLHLPFPSPRRSPWHQCGGVSHRSFLLAASVLFHDHLARRARLQLVPSHRGLKRDSAGLGCFGSRASH
jgi:hypothetical protein